MNASQFAQTLVFAIPTFRRPKLLREALGSILAEFGRENFPRVVVAENDVAHSEGAVAARLWSEANDLSDQVHVVEVQDKGLSNCRNAALAFAFSLSSVENVSMFDDDAQLAPGWLVAMSSALAQWQADVFGGPTKYLVPSDASPMVKRAPVFGVPYEVTGYVAKLRSSNNFLLTKTAYQMSLPIVFSQDFNFSGGEDSQFFERGRRAGLKMVWVSDAAVIEPVPVDRATETWVLQRHRLSAINAARVACSVSGWVGRGEQLLLILKELVSAVCWAILWRPKSSEMIKYRVIGVWGRILGLLGIAQKHG